MKRIGSEWRFSSRDLSEHLACRHLTRLEMGVAAGTLRRPKPWDPSLDTLWERGLRHEREYLEHLEAHGLRTVLIEAVEIDESAVAATRAAMAEGVPVIVQAALTVEGWVGRADVLRRVETPSTFGSWSYEAYDTKLSRTTGSSAIMQLSLYSELLAVMQGVAPERMHVVPPWTGFEPRTYRVAEYVAYHRRARRAFEAAVARGGDDDTYPEPTSHCDVCAWRVDCGERRRRDDHLSLVAGISSLQIAELRERGIRTVEALAAMPLPLEWRPERGSRSGFERVREQARLQVESRIAGTMRFETLQIEAGFGLAALPAPSHGDVYLDFEGDSFAGEHGQEYLLGYHFIGDAGDHEYVALWGLSREDERRAFERFVDFVIERWSLHPGMHVYHYGAYEQSALKRLMGRHATREEELDRILRGRVMVNLLSIVRHAIRAGVESYSIKRLEPLYGYERDTALPDANLALARIEAALELGDPDGIGMAERDAVQGYNRDDCVSTRHLHRWLEGLRDGAIAQGQVIERPGPGDGAPGEGVSEWLARIGPMVEALVRDLPDDPADRSPAEQGRWLLANMLDFHRREDKATWWEYFRLADLDAEELVEERAALGGGLAFRDVVDGTDRCPIHRYGFLPQETDLRPGRKLREVGGRPFGTVEAIDAAARTIDVRKTQACADVHPDGVFAHEHVGSEPMMEALVRIAQHVITEGMEGAGPFRAARDLLMRAPPPGGGLGFPMRRDGETTLDAALRLVGALETGVLPIQGPPGAGKTFTGSRMIVEMVRLGRKVGIVANSHAVVRNLLDAVIEGAGAAGVDLMCVQKPASREQDATGLRIVTKAPDLLRGLETDCQVGGGTAWLWATEAAFEAVDVLFVDEAAQMSLANVLAVSQAARAIVLLGDPRQLDQPMQGSHPEGTDTSALNHLLGGALTIPADRGLFLEETWRLHPSICEFTSEMFYEGKLRSRDGLDRQCVSIEAPMSGLRYVPVEHSGNHNCSPEEADVVAALVEGLVEAGTWIDRDGVVRRIGVEDVLVITPYNAQVFELQRRLPGIRVGTVDKLQDQEAPVTIYSLATSDPADAPRGMEFLYSLNRLNVATSRARCLSYLVCSPALFGAECRSPGQMKLANAFCRYLELAT